ncbi:hypothetical protein LCGC14_1940370, partial [marine sediment metagenome]
MRQHILVAAILAIASSAPGKVDFKVAPKVSRVAGQAAVSFAVTAPTDVEVSVVDAAGKVVRHLAAGMVGGPAAKPLKTGSLAQTLIWDGKDDAGRPVKPEGLKVRVRIGSSARLEKLLGWDAQLFGGYGGVKSMAVGERGELFVLESRAGGMAIRVLD